MTGLAICAAVASVACAIRPSTPSVASVAADTTVARTQLRNDGGDWFACIAMRATSDGRDSSHEQNGTAATTSAR